MALRAFLFLARPGRPVPTMWRTGDEKPLFGRIFLFISPREGRAVPSGGGEMAALAQYVEF